MLDVCGMLDEQTWQNGQELKMLQYHQSDIIWASNGSVKAVQMNS